MEALISFFEEVTFEYELEYDFDDNETLFSSGKDLKFSFSFSFSSCFNLSRLFFAAALSNIIYILERRDMSLKVLTVFKFILIYYSIIL